MQLTLNKVIPPVSPDKWRFQLVVVQSLPKSVYLDRERFMEFIDRIPIPKHRQGVMFERLDRDQEFNFSSAIAVPEDLAREFGLLDE
jgi:hypothetical protein